MHKCKRMSFFHFIIILSWMNVNAFPMSNERVRASRSNVGVLGYNPCNYCNNYNEEREKRKEEHNWRIKITSLKQKGTNEKSIFSSFVVNVSFKYSNTFIDVVYIVCVIHIKYRWNMNNQFNEPVSFGCDARSDVLVEFAEFIWLRMIMNINLWEKIREKSNTRRTSDTWHDVSGVKKQ